jgi:outer membrane protein assembly factor BamA
MKLIDGILLAALALPAAAQHQMTASPMIESVDFEGLTDAQQKLVTSRLTVRRGDLLSTDAKQRVARELQAIGLDLTFSYKAGARYGTARLKISAGC